MEFPLPVLIHNELLGLKGVAGLLIQIYPEGFYLVATSFGSNTHKVQLPIDQTVLIHEVPEEEAEAGEPIEIER
jgi:hypothetical protein